VKKESAHNKVFEYGSRAVLTGNVICTEKLGHPVFLLSVTLLIINDWFLKQNFANTLTGKLSDFAGIFALPYLLSVFIPRWKKQVHIATAFLFVFWKSDLAEPVIDFVNCIGIPVHRTKDITDNVALLSLFASYHILGLNYSLFKKSYVLNTILIVSSISFVATSLPPSQQRKYTGINKDYNFDISKRELVSRLNTLQLKEIANVSKVSGGRVDFDAEKNTFHYRGSTDTLALIMDYSKVDDSDTIIYKSSYAEVVILGNETRSTLKLVSIFRLVPAFKEKDYRDKAIKTFEKRVVKKIRRFPKPPVK
jgi:hypothetical protein